MHAAALGVLLLIGAAGLCCAPVQSPALDPSGRTDPRLAPDEEAALPGRPPPPAPERPKPIVPRTPAPIAGCPLEWTPRDLHASVITFPKSFVARFMEPIYGAMCACTRPGDHLSLSARIVTGTGEIELRSGTRPDLQTKED